MVFYTSWEEIALRKEFSDNFTVTGISSSVLRSIIVLLEINKLAYSKSKSLYTVLHHDVIWISLNPGHDFVVV
jgi:hypothetical protein